jgi:hypothetical protein
MQNSENSFSDEYAIYQKFKKEFEQYKEKDQLKEVISKFTVGLHPQQILVQKMEEIHS